MKKKNQLKYSLGIIGIILLYLLPLIGPCISFIYQIQIQQEMFGYYSTVRHIWTLYDLWDLTLFIYVPILLTIGE